MGEPRKPKPVRLLMSLIMASEAILPKVVEDLEGFYGDTEFLSPSMAFDFTDYYASEMGTDLRRRFIAFRDLIPPEALSSVKRQTNRLELQYARQGKRQVNIDPGYLSGSHLILATTKAYAHRPYLDDGIYADLTLIYRLGSYRPLEWTYPDYRQQHLVEMFNRLRKTYFRQLNEGTEFKDRS